jgi:hypothetical protein
MMLKFKERREVVLRAFNKLADDAFTVLKIFLIF